MEAVAVILNLRALNYDRENYGADFSSDVSLSHIIWWGDKPFDKDVRVEGKVVKQTEGYLLEYTASFSYIVPCARCLNEVKKSESQSFHHELKEFADLEKEPENGISLNRDNLNLTELVVSDIVPLLADVVLCEEDCLGLCLICGGNLNKTKCDCEKETITDPRFNVLRELLIEID